MDEATTLPKMRYCSIQSCINFKGTTSDKFHFFKPSMEKHILEKWKEAISQHQNFKNITFVCNLHFEPESLIKMDEQLFLKHGSIPSIFGSVQVPESEIQNEEVVVKMEPMSIDSQCIVQLVNINEILQNASTLKDEPTSEVSQNRQLNHIGPAICDGCFKRDLENQVLSVELEREREMVRYWKSIAMQYIPESVKLARKSPEGGYAPPSPEVFKDSANPTVISMELIKVEGKPHEDMDVGIEPYEASTLIEAETTEIEATTVEPVTIETASIEITDDEEIDVNVEKPVVEVLDPLLKPYKCGKCFKSFQKPEELEFHIKEHMNAFKRCVVCRVSYEEGQMDQHLCIEEESISCEHCPQTYTSTNHLLEHLENAHNEVEWHRCSRCCQPFKMMFLKSIHKRCHDVDKPFKCNLCLKSFTMQESFIRHQKREHINPKPKPKSKPELKPESEPTKPNPDSKPISLLCDQCGKEFSSQSKLSGHCAKHTELKYKCPHCPYVSRYKRSLDKHSYTHRNEIFVCSVCGEKKTSPENLRRHMVFHSTTDSFECEICSKKFKNKGNLKQHNLLVHANRKGFQCTFCNNLYKYRGDLSKHLKIHLGDKIYECKECSERFRLHSELQIHSFTHYKGQQMTTSSTAAE